MYGDVNPNWPHGDWGEWPHLSRVVVHRAGGLGGLAPEDAGGVAVDLEQDVVDGWRRRE
jgi:hypothetical protein